MRTILKIGLAPALWLGMSVIVPVYTVAAEAGSAGAVADDQYGDSLGTVRFPVSCRPVASARAERGLALMHHMTYEGARAQFAAAAEADPDCAMAYWGQAMTHIHPLWSDPPADDEFEAAQALLSQARDAGPGSDWERAYIDAAAAYYDVGRHASEKPNLAAFEAAWQKIHEAYPQDTEAASLYALAHLATADPSDKSYKVQRQAADTAMQVLILVPDHPGAHHYTIHAYDYPALAGKALDVAHNYGAIAPDVPHALHMPTHIFTRRGLWPDSITMNRRSAEAALKHPAGDRISLHYQHALDYMAYAYLQRGEDEAAEQVRRTMEAQEGPFQPHVASAYTFAAVPARLALERQAWGRAAVLEPRVPENYPWDGAPAMEAITYFGRALGSAHMGDTDSARAALERLAVLRDQAAGSSDYWATQVEIQLLAAQAWLEYMEGDAELGLETMRRAADMEAATEKHPVTPGEVLPARELLGDMLLDMGRYGEAGEAYAAALERSPNRLNSLYGAGRAAELAGDMDRAADYYRQLVEITTPESDLDRIVHAREMVAAR